MSAQHSPGPWRASAAAQGGFSPIMASGGVIVALVSTLSPKAKDDARLIAAAPEMAKLIADIEESLTADNSYRLLREACQAILAKIGGEA